MMTAAVEEAARAAAEAIRMGLGRESKLLYSLWELDSGIS